MSIEIIDILKPKNGLNFKLIEDVDVAVQGYSSLADAVSHFVTLEGIQQIINAALSGKQDKLTTEQLAACNSGITSQLVTQIGTNTTAIAGKADAADLTALAAVVDTKADDSDLSTATANLQSQIDAIVTPVTQDAEVQNARIAPDGTTYATLKQRCDATDNKLTNVDYVSKVNSLNKKYEAIITGNLIDKSTLLEKSYLLEDGSVATAQAGYYVTDYIPLYGKDVSAITGGNSSFVGACVYDSEFNFIKNYKAQTITHEFTTGDCYIRFMLREAGLPNARAFYGDTVKAYTAFTSNEQQNAIDIINLDSRLTTTEGKESTNEAAITNMQSKMIPVDELSFSAYESPVTQTLSLTFKGFATPYEYHGLVTKVDVNAGYVVPENATGDFTLTIYESDFTTVVATVTKTLARRAGIESFTLENPIVLNGVYYFAVTADDANTYFTVANETNNNSKRSSSTPNKYILSSSPNIWENNTSGYDIDLYLYTRSYDFPSGLMSNTIYIGSTEDCQYADVQTALNSITDDTTENPYIFYVKAGTYEPFSMYYTNAERTTSFGRIRNISIIGLGCRNDVIFTDNRGNYKYSPCEIYTNGVIKNMSFIDRTDSEHHTQETGRTFAYAVHSDFGTCKTRFENCYMYSNAGPAIGIGTWKDEVLEFQNCRFESGCDGTYGDSGLGAIFAHTATDGTNRTNQVLRIHDCIAIAPAQANGARFAVIAGYEGGTYSYEFQNFGSFGQNGAAVSLQAPDNDLLSPYCFNNTPSSLNK